jgi:gamma-glutamyltranspeptidase/glutathione hydrolase
MFFNYKSLIFLVIFFSYSCHDTTQDSGFKNGLIVSAKIEASQAGINILKQGGNAFDAMIATGISTRCSLPQRR